MPDSFWLRFGGSRFATSITLSVRANRFVVRTSGWCAHKQMLSAKAVNLWTNYSTGNNGLT